MGLLTNVLLLIKIPDSYSKYQCDYTM